MSSFTEPPNATTTRREPILICHDDSPDAAVIVIGSRGLTGVKKILGASLSQQVTEHAGRPVLTVPPSR